MGKWRLSGRGLGVCVLLAAGFGWASGARAALLSEIVPGGGGYAEAYVEITFLGDVDAVDLVVFDADRWKPEPIVRAVVRIDRAAAVDVTVVHQGPWAGNSFTPEVTSGFQVEKLPLAATDGARRVALFERAESPTTWQVNTKGIPVTEWSSDSTPALLDVVSYAVNGPSTSWPWEVDNPLGEPKLDLTPTGGAWRIKSNGDWTDNFEVGEADALDLDPARVNVDRPHAPEPSAMLLLGLGATALLGRRRRVAAD